MAACFQVINIPLIAIKHVYVSEHLFYRQGEVNNAFLSLSQAYTRQKLAILFSFNILAWESQYTVLLLKLIILPLYLKPKVNVFQIFSVLWTIYLKLQWNASSSFLVFILKNWKAGTWFYASLQGQGLSWLEVCHFHWTAQLWHFD